MSTQLNANKYNKRGLVYKCLHCPPEVAIMGEKNRVMGHIMKMHLALDQNKFYCTLCMYRAKDRAPFLRHTTSFEPHIRQQLERGVNYEGDQFYLKENPNPHQIIVGKDLVPLTQTQSAAHWAERSKVNAPSLTQAKQQHIPVLPQHHNNIPVAPQHHNNLPIPYSPRHPSIFYEPPPPQLRTIPRTTDTCLSQYLPLSSPLVSQEPLATTCTFITNTLNSIVNTTPTMENLRSSTPLTVEEPFSPQVSSPVRKIIENDQEDLRAQLMDFEPIHDISFLNNDDISMLNNNVQSNKNNNTAHVEVKCNDSNHTTSSNQHQQLLDAMTKLEQTNERILKQQDEQIKYIKDLTSAMCCLRGQVRQQERTLNKQQGCIDRLLSNTNRPPSKTFRLNRFTPYVKSKPKVTRKPQLVKSTVQQVDN